MIDFILKDPLSALVTLDSAVIRFGITLTFYFFPLYFTILDQ